MGSPMATTFSLFATQAAPRFEPPYTESEIVDAAIQEPASRNPANSPMADTISTSMTATNFLDFQFADEFEAVEIRHGGLSSWVFSCPSDLMGNPFREGGRFPAEGG